MRLTLVVDIVAVVELGNYLPAQARRAPCSSIVCRSAPGLPSLCVAILFRRHLPLRRPFSTAAEAIGGWPVLFRGSTGLVPGRTTRDRIEERVEAVAAIFWFTLRQASRVFSEDALLDAGIEGNGSMLNGAWAGEERRVTLEYSLPAGCNSHNGALFQYLELGCCRQKDARLQNFPFRKENLDPKGASPSTT